MNAPIAIHAMLREVEGQLDAWCEKEERRCDTYRPPNFQMLPTYAELRRRREVASTFGIAFGIGIMLGVVIAILFIL